MARPSAAQRAATTMASICRVKNCIQSGWNVDLHRNMCRLQPHLDHPQVLGQQRTAVSVYWLEIHFPLTEFERVVEQFQ